MKTQRRSHIRGEGLTDFLGHLYAVMVAARAMPYPGVTH
jgi:hypothetical protein